MYKYIFLLIPILLLGIEKNENSENQTLSRSFVFSPKEAIDYALSHNKEIQAAKKMIEVAVARYEGAGVPENPTLSIKYGNDSFFDDEGEETWGIELSQRFSFTRKLHKTKQVAEMDIDLARVELEDARRDLRFEVQKQLLEMGVLDSQIELHSKIYSLNEELWSFAKVRASKGEVSILDVNQSQIEYKSRERDLQQYRADRIRVENRLKTLMGLSVKEEIRIDGILMQHFPVVEKSHPEVAFGNRPDYQKMQTWVDKARREKRLSKAQRWGDFELSLFYEEEKAMDTPVGLEKGRTIGLGISFPIPVVNTNSKEIKALELLEERAQLLLESLELKIQNEINASLAYLKNLKEIVDSYEEEEMEFARKNVELTHKAYAEGQVPLFLVMKSQEQNIHLESEYLSVWKSYQLELLKYAYIQGF